MLTPGTQYDLESLRPLLTNGVAAEVTELQVRDSRFRVKGVSRELRVQGQGFRV